MQKSITQPPLLPPSEPLSASLSSPALTIHLLTIFPEFFTTPLQQSILKRAQEKGLVRFHVVNIRDFAMDKRRTTDDRPFGGGPGMVMKVEPIVAALEMIQGKNLKLRKNEQEENDHEQKQEEDSEEKRLEKKKLEKEQKRHRHEKEKLEGEKSEFFSQHLTLLTSARGKAFTQHDAQRYMQVKELTIICGHYEGVDQRIADHFVDEEVRIGDYVLSGGESAALVIVDAVTRLIPGVLGNEESNKNESHTIPGEIGSPQYTRPEEFYGMRVPEVLLSGDQKKIEEWKTQESH